MRPTVEGPFCVRGREYGGAKPLFCIPIVAADEAQLLSQAGVARSLAPDLVEWRADAFQDPSVSGLIGAAMRLRSVLPDEPVIFTLRIRAEGGAQEISQQDRRTFIEAVAASRRVDMLDVELRNEAPFLESVLRVAHRVQVRVILSFHDFHATPPNTELIERITEMQGLGADVAKIAVMPQTSGDVLRLLEVTLEARTLFPRLPLCTMSMGRLGSISRTAGFLFGSDMAFAVGQQSSAPGQIAISEARSITEKLLQYT